jgi:hypothetical protein
LILLTAGIEHHRRHHRHRAAEQNQREIDQRQRDEDELHRSSPVSDAPSAGERLQKSVRTHQRHGFARLRGRVEHVDKAFDLVGNEALMHEIGPDLRQTDERPLCPVVARCLRKFHAFGR